MPHRSRIAAVTIAAFTVIAAGCATRHEPAEHSVSIKDTPSDSRPARAANAPTVAKPKLQAAKSKTSVEPIGTSVATAKPVRPKTAVARPADARSQPSLPPQTKPVATKPAATNPAAAKPAAIDPDQPCETTQACEAIVKALVESPDRSWIGVRPTTARYATSMRSLAFERLRASLTCQELVLASEEMSMVTTAYSQPIAGVTAAAAQNVIQSAARTEAQLKAEIKSRC